MAIGTYEAYMERMKKMRPNIYLNGECLDRLHCGNESGFWVMKQCYEIANDPAYADVCQVKSHVTGEIVNRCTHIHQSKDDLLKKQLMTRLICHHVGGCMQRCMGTDALNAIAVASYDCDKATGTKYYDRFIEYLKYCQKYGSYKHALTDFLFNA